MKDFRKLLYSIFAVLCALSSSGCSVVTTIAWGHAYPVRGVAIMPSETNPDELFKTAQSAMAMSRWMAYNITQSNPQTGIISGRHEFATGIEIFNIQISKEKDGKIYVLMLKDYQAKSESTLGPKPPQIAKAEIIHTAKVLAKTLKIKENDITMQFKDEQKPLSSYE